MPENIYLVSSWDRKLDREPLLRSRMGDGPRNEMRSVRQRSSYGGGTFSLRLGGLVTLHVRVFCASDARE